MDTRDAEGGHLGPGSVTLPEKKVVKCRDLVNDRTFDPGVRQLRTHSVQILRGNGEWMAIV